MVKPATAITTGKQNNISVIDSEEEKFLRETAGAGLEGVTMADQLVPRLKLVQKISYELEPLRPEYIEDAKVGDFVNSASKRIIKRPHLVPCAYQIQYVEWKPNRVGLAKNWMQDRSMFDKATFVEEGGKKFFKVPNGNVMQPTGTFFCLEVSNDLPEMVVVQLASTQFKKSQGWVTRLSNERIKLDSGEILKAATFYRSYLCDPQPESGGANNWLGWRITPDVPTIELPNGRAIRNVARDLSEAVKAGTVKAEIEEEIIHGDDDKSGDY